MQVRGSGRGNCRDREKVEVWNLGDEWKGNGIGKGKEWGRVRSGERRGEKKNINYNHIWKLNRRRNRYKAI